MTKVKQAINLLEKDPLWYKSGIIYELHVRAFFDSNGDGIGDFPGLTQKLDYLQELGVTALWLLPFYPSPLKDDGYDIADYDTIHPYYGTLDDFKTFLDEAHSRNMRVITELVLNHTSDQHAWFQRSRRAPAGSPWRDFYVWSDNPEKYKEVRIIFPDFEASNWTWDPIAKAYYWHRFFSHQPDLNYDNPLVHQEILKVFNFWLELGVDGFRLDAVPYLYEREGTSGESLPETHHFLKVLRKHVDENYADRMLLAEANQWPETAVNYFGQGKGDECHMAFHFPLMPRLFLAVRMEDRIPIVDILEQTPALPETSQWALFLRNHDELTLEMVTDEERDYMYRVYASDIKSRINLGIRRRLAPLLGNDRKRIELLNLLLLSLPGTPVIYYGDEIGMGENIFLGDRNGVRTPMHWSSDKNAGFSRCNPQGLFLPIILDPEYHYEANNVEVHQRNPHSLLWWMKRLLALRKRWKAFGMGSLQFLHPDNRKVLAYIRKYEDELILVVANLSRFPQSAELDLANFQNMVPVELFGQNEFPRISEKPYSITLSPHSAFWFSLEPRHVREQGKAGLVPSCSQTLLVEKKWEEVFRGKTAGKLEACLPGYLGARNWFAGRGRGIKQVHLKSPIPIEGPSATAYIGFVLVEYSDGESEEYLLPLTFAAGKEAENLRKEWPQFIISNVRIREGEVDGILYDAVADPQFCGSLLELLTRQKKIKENGSEISSTLFQGKRTVKPGPTRVESITDRIEQSNTLLVYNKKSILKLFRRLEPGLNPEVELTQLLTEKNFPHSPTHLGSIELRRSGEESIRLAQLSEYIPNVKDGWTYTLDTLGRFFERILSKGDLSQIPDPGENPLHLARQETPTEVSELVGTYLELSRQLGELTADLHLTLASPELITTFQAEPITPYQQRSIYQSMRNEVVGTLQGLRKKLKTLPDSVRPLAESISSRESDILKCFKPLLEVNLHGMRIRCHGNYHLEQVLYTGKDFKVIDFEGDSRRPMGERRIKRSPFRDVASMIRSLHYAAHASLSKQVEIGAVAPEAVPSLEPWCRFWHLWVSAAFLRSYLAKISPANLIPKTEEGQDILFTAHYVEKAVAEIGIELNRRPDWLHIPLRAVHRVLENRKKP